MKPEIKEKWVNALRSGEYKQGKSCMVDTYHNYCCLGVLSDLYAKENNVSLESLYGRECFGNIGETTLLNEQVVSWAGLNNKLVYVEFEDNIVDIASLNDNSHDFRELSNIIEEQL